MLIFLALQIIRNIKELNVLAGEGVARSVVDKSGIRVLQVRSTNVLILLLEVLCLKG